MKRLTEKRRFKDFRPDEEITTICVDGYFEVVDNYNNFSCGKESHYYLVGEAIDKLAEYEDAEEQGLLLRIPCKVGDTVFHRKEYAATFTGIREYQITNIMISQNKKGEWTKKYRAMMWLDGKTIDCPINFAFDDIGKTVFLTKAEAEKALAEMG